MKTPSPIRLGIAVLLVAGGVLFPRTIKANFVGSDDFSSVSGLWGPDSVSGSARFTVSGGVLNYTTVPTPTPSDSAERYWTANVGSYTKAWSVQVDLTMANFPSSENAYAGIIIENAGNSGDQVRLLLFGGPPGGTRRYYADALTNNSQTEPSAQPATGSTTVSMRLSFDPSTKMITASRDDDGPANGYSFTPFFSVNVNSATSPWNMTEGSTFKVHLGVVTNNVAISEGQLAFDNFRATQSVVSLAVAADSVTKAVGNAAIGVIRTGDSTNALSARLKISDITTSPNDYVANGDFVVSWAAGDSATKTVLLPIVDDSKYELNAQLLVTLSTDTVDATTGAITAETITIINNEPPPVLQFTSSGYSVSEADGVALVTITKTGLTELSATTHYSTTDGTAKAGSDYVATSGDVTFAPGETSKNVAIPLVDGNVYEMSKTFSISLAAPSGATLGQRTTSQVTIQNDDPPPLFQFSTNTISVKEDVGNVILTLTKTGATEVSASVHYSTADGTAKAGSDYTAVSGDLTFAPGENTKTITVPVSDDNIYEANATFLSFNVTLSNPINADLGGNANALITITDSETQPPQPLNISTRVRVGTGDNALIGGFILSGSDTKTVLIRALGPSLRAAGVQEVLNDPTLELYDSTGSLLSSNDDWQQSPRRAAIEASGVAPPNPLESAILTTLPAGAGYTAVVKGKNNASGIGLVEVYDLSLGAPSRLANISTRGIVGTNDSVMIAGFIVGGEEADRTKLVLRAIGPSLGAVGIANSLQDPTLNVYNQNGDVVAANDNWKQGMQSEIATSGLAPKDDRESAVYVALANGGYTAVVSGVNGTTGVGLVEVYNLQ